jgi:GAF domain-containing protein
MPEGSASEPMTPSGQMGSLLFTEETLDGVLDTIVSLARRTIGPVEHASVTLRRNDRYTTTHATSEVARELDECQYVDGRGPCVDVSNSGEQLLVSVVPDDGRWPIFATRAAEVGVRWVLSTALATRRRPLGGLNLYAGEDDAFGSSDAELAELFARQASTVLENAMSFSEAQARNRQLEEALETRETIAQAMGILMARQRITSDEAFDILRRASQRQNRKLRELAGELVESATAGRTDGSAHS